MTDIELVAETPDTLTRRRTGYEALRHAADDAADIAALAARRAHEARVG